MPAHFWQNKEHLADATVHQNVDLSSDDSRNEAVGEEEFEQGEMPYIEVFRIN